MKTFMTAVSAVGVSFVLSGFGELLSPPGPQRALESTPACAAPVASDPHRQAPCKRMAENNPVSSSHPGEHK
jgi:hypothetical protein